MKAALKMSFGQGYWNESNTSLYINNWRSVWLSQQWEGQEISPADPPSPGLNCQAGIGRRNIRRTGGMCEEFWCFSAWTHAKSVKNMASLWSHARPRYEGLHAEQPATVAYIKLTSHSLWMLVSGELRLTLYSKSSTLQIKNNVITPHQLLNSIILPQCLFCSSHVSTNPQPNPDCGHVNSDLLDETIAGLRDIHSQTAVWSNNIFLNAPPVLGSNKGSNDGENVSVCFEGVECHSAVSYQFNRFSQLPYISPHYYRNSCSLWPSYRVILTKLSVNVFFAGTDSRKFKKSSVFFLNKFGNE